MAGVPQSEQVVLCPKKITLVVDYGAAVAAYHSAVQTLEAWMIKGSAEIYRRHRKDVEAARQLCEAARKALDDHEAEDECEVNPPPSHPARH